MFGEEPPEGSGVGRAHGLAFEEDGAGSGEEGCVQDVGVADYPADVGCAEHGVAGTRDTE